MNGTIVDLHSHVIPGVDDGARSVEEGLGGLRAFLAQGVGVVTATPHVDASLTTRSASLVTHLERMDRALSRLTEAAEEEGLDVGLERGVELKLDSPEPDLSDPRLRLGGSEFVLVEFVGFAVPPFAERQLEQLREAGWIPLLAHPERYRGIEVDLDRAASWKEGGVYFQVNAGAILGQYGTRIRKVARQLLERGLADCLASDHHSRGEPPTESARLALEEVEGGAEVARLLLEENPARILRGEAPRPVPPLEVSEGIWKGLRGIFG